MTALLTPSEDSRFAALAVAAVGPAVQAAGFGYFSKDAPPSAELNPRVAPTALFMLALASFPQDQVGKEYAINWTLLGAAGAPVYEYAAAFKVQHTGTRLTVAFREIPKELAMLPPGQYSLSVSLTSSDGASYADAVFPISVVQRPVFIVDAGFSSCDEATCSPRDWLDAWSDPVVVGLDVYVATSHVGGGDRDLHITRYSTRRSTEVVRSLAVHWTRRCAAHCPQV